MRPWQVRTTALALFGATCVLLMSTMDVGFTRDESFYFHYALTYQHWFADLEDDGARPADVLGRDAVLRTWRGNFEHPPLMKTAFGFAWRAFARKDRDAGPLRAEGGHITVSVRGIGSADGFAEGADVLLLAPLRAGREPDGGDRVLAHGEVMDRSRASASVALRGFGSEDLDELQEACAPRPGDEAASDEPGEPPVITGCQLREDRPMAILAETTAMRLPAVVATGLAVALTFLLGIELFGAAAGFFGALAFLLTPRHFFHAHLICFDMAIVTAVLATLYAFWRARRDRRWALAAGVCWGLALLIKHNAFFLPVPLVLWWLWCGRHELRLPRGPGGRRRLRLPRIPLAFLVMPVVALPMLFVLWPKLWYDPFKAVVAYFQFHLSHAHYLQYYFGQPLQVPPFPFELPFVLTVFTLPEVYLALTAVGLLYAAPPRSWLPALRGIARREAPSERERALSFTLLNGLVPILLIAMPNVPIFGGVKHWMTGMPFLMLLMGFGLATALRHGLAFVRAAPLRLVVAATVVALVFAEPGVASVRSVAFGTGYYNSLIAGGIQGAADRMMMRMYWGHTSRQALSWLNEHAPRGARVYFQNTTHGAYTMYRRDGLLRADIRFVGSAEGAQLALIEPQKSFAEIDIDTQEALGVTGPVHVVTCEGVPMLRVYARPDVLLPAAPKPGR